jgi:phage tail sheath protein FI
VVPETTTRPSYPEFRECLPSEPPLQYPDAVPVAVLLDGGGQNLDEALGRQSRVVALADRQRRFVALLDVPDRLRPRDIGRWRSALSSSYAAAYHPWLGTVPEGRERPGGASLRRLAPSAVAAGIIASRERRLGLPWGPAAEIAVDAVRVARDLGDAEHAELFDLGINVYRAERDGFRLSSARTLSHDPDYTQLSVRRLMTMLRLTLERQGQRLAFEPNTPALRQDLTWQIRAFLRSLHQDGAFAGASEEESFFVRCDDALNPPWSQNQGRLVAEIGVAPAAPLEFIVLRLARDASGAVGVEG